MDSIRHFAAALLLAAISFSVCAAADDWDPKTAPTLHKEQPQDLLINGRAFEVFQHGAKPGWGYKEPLQDHFIVVHPKVDRKNSPLYVVLHSAGHDAYSSLRCTRDIGNHDIYRSPDDFYALYLDCRAAKDDWWWGGMHLGDQELIKRNSSGPMPVERRVIDTVKWVMRRYGIDPNRVYLSGNSMGASGALGIGMPNGDIFAAIKANVPAGIEHVSNRMYFAPQSVPKNVKLPDPPIVVDYSGQNDGWSNGHDRFIKAMNDRRYALYMYWAPYGHANNHAEMEKLNDLINTFDWLSVKKNEAYPVFTNASCNDAIPWPDNTGSKASGQINAFFRWKDVKETKSKLSMSLFLLTKEQLKTTFAVPSNARADVSFRRLQKLQIKPGEHVKWSFVAAKGTVTADATGLVTIPGLEIAPTPTVLTITKGSR